MRTLDTRIRDFGGYQLDRADRVVISGNRIGDVVRVAVAVHDGNDGNIKSPRFLNGDFFDPRIEDEDRSRKAPHVLDTGQVFLKLGDIFLHEEDFLLFETVLAGVQERRLHFLHFIDAASDGLKVGQHPTQPALVDEKHVGSLSFFFEDFCRLPLGADEQDGFSACNKIADESIGVLHSRNSLLKVDNIDAAAFTEQKLLHLGIPAVGLMTEMNACFQQLLDRHHSHAFTSLRACRAPTWGEGTRFPYSQAVQRIDAE